MALSLYVIFHHIGYSTVVDARQIPEDFQLLSYTLLSGTRVCLYREILRGNPSKSINGRKMDRTWSDARLTKKLEGGMLMKHQATSNKRTTNFPFGENGLNNIGQLSGQQEARKIERLI